MASDQEILKARTFRVADAIRNSAHSAEDADWWSTKVRIFPNADRYVNGTLTPVQLVASPGQNYADFLTPWEQEWSVLANSHQQDSYTSGFTPIVDEKGTVIAHRGLVHNKELTPLIASYGDLFYTLPKETLTKTDYDSTKPIRDIHAGHDELRQLLKDGANIFVHSLKPGDEIRLISYEVGRPGGPAQQLANELGRHKVWAPNTKVAGDPTPTGMVMDSFVPLKHGKFSPFMPQRGDVTTAGNGAKVTTNQVKGEIRSEGKK